MSDSSGSESDDDILNSSIFTKKPDRRSERAEKQKMDFLDQCLESTNARTDVQRRIADVEREQQQWLVKEEALVKEEDESGDSKDDAIGGVGLNTNNDKENITNHAAVKLEVNVKVEPSADTATTPSTSNQQSKRSLIDDNDESYWERVENFAKTNSTKQKNGDINTTRRKLADAMNGLDYDSETDDEDGKWVNGSSGMTREQKRSEAAAKMTGGQSLLGLRRMFLPVDKARETKLAVGSRNRNTAPKKVEASDGLGYYLFDSRDEAKSELKSIMSELEKSHRKTTTQAQTVLREDFIDPLNKLIKKCPQDLFWSSMTFFLRHNPVITFRSKHTCAVAIPETFCMWMWKVACSSYEVMGKLSTCTCQLLVRYLREELDVDDFSSYAELAFVKKFKMIDISICLADDFGLWLKSGPIILPKIEGSVQNEDGKNSMDISTLDTFALKNSFMLWSALLDRDYLSLGGNENEDEIHAVGEGAAKALAAMARASLDPRLWTSDQYSNACARMLPNVIQDFSASIVKSAIRQISQLHGEESVEIWMKKTATCIVDSCSNLSAGGPDTADADDTQGHLPLAIAVTKLITREINDFSIDTATMKVMFAERALQTCLSDLADWDDRVKELTDARCRDLTNDSLGGNPSKGFLRHAIHGIVTAEIGMQWIEQQIETFMQDKPRFLASVQIAGESALVGIAIFRCTNVADQTGKSLYTTEENDAICESLSNLEDLCNELKKECRAVIAYPHLRRAKEYLTRLGKTIGGTRGRSSKDQRKKMREQGSLDSFILRSDHSLSSP